MIRMSKETDYAIVLLTVFAGGATDSVFSSRELSERVRVPLPMVSKVLKALSKGGLLLSQRGARGGYVLARPAEEISIADVMQATEGSVALTECLDQPGDCIQEPTCHVRGHWEKINDRVLSALDEVSIAEMADRGASDLVSLESEGVVVC